MKKLFSLLAMLTAIVLTAGAQSMQVATLSHDGTITSYTSADALRQAYDAAVDGDVITLSSGVFNSVNLEKRITVRGAGMGIKVNDTDPYVEPTIIKGVYKIKVPGDGNNSLKMESVICLNRVEVLSITNAHLLKCYFYDFDGQVNETDPLGYANVTIINSVFKNFDLPYRDLTFNLYGCHIKDLGVGSSDNRLVNYTNCIIESYSTSNMPISDSVLKNSLIIYHGPHSWYGLGTAYNTVIVGNLEHRGDFYESIEENNNTLLPTGTQLFKEGTFYQLNDEGKKYLGSDGTEVGIYGGSLPFDPTPTNPQITKFNVAPKTTADGKLSIDIEVNAK